MRNNSAVYGGRRGVKNWLRDLFEILKSLDSNHEIMFEVPMTYWGFSDALVMMRFQQKHFATFSRSFSLTGSNNDLYIHPRALNLSINSRVYYPGFNHWIVIYMDVADSNNSSRLIKKTTWSPVRMCHLQARPL